LETDSLTVELTPLKKCSIASGKWSVLLATDHRSPATLFNLFMRRVLAATAAELLKFQPFRRRLPVLGGRIIPLFAITAL